MRKIVQILLFIISYSPLYLILFFQNLNDDIYLKDTKDFIGIKEVLKLNTTSLSFLALIVVSISLYFLFFNIVLKSSSEKYTIKEIKSNSVEHLSYLATYILPFVGLKFDSWQSILATISLFYVLGHIYIKTNMILTNPTLTFFGYAISTVIDSNDKTKLVIHKKGMIKNKELDFVPLVENIYILKQKINLNE
jgi:hypothetical protein